MTATNRTMMLSVVLYYYYFVLFANSLFGGNIVNSTRYYLPTCKHSLMHAHTHLLSYTLARTWFHYQGLLLHTELIVSMFIRCIL